MTLTNANEKIAQPNPAPLETAHGSVSEPQLSDETPEIPLAEFIDLDPNERLNESVRVSISYGIIQRFSEGLYSSPNKAFEELVSNSYDAGATRVWVSLPIDLESHDTAIAVLDDGDSMDLAGLQELWTIGESSKRDGEALATPPKKRRPIGKFGIGKLATYVLANKLTFICHKDGVYRAVTMNYGEVTGQLANPNILTLSVVHISRVEAQRSLSAVVTGSPALEVLFGTEEPSTWTAAVLTNLKDPARQLKRGVLRWILSTALPLSPQFSLWFNNEVVEASKASGTRVWSFTVGKSDKSERSWKWQSNVDIVDSQEVITLPNAGPITGEAELFADTLKRGKSGEHGRSHGFFVRVRGRLINLADETFGIDVELHHGILTRFRMVVDADGLDAHLASPRESIQESPALDEVRAYLLAVFNRARAAQPDLDSGTIIRLISANGRIARPPAALSQAPLRRMIRRAVEGDEVVSKALGLSDEDHDVARKLLDQEKTLLDRILIEQLNDDEPLVQYDPKRQATIVNARHPFINNYLDRKDASEPLKFVGLAELLTEAFMLDEAVNPEVVRRIMNRRQKFLTALVNQHPRSAVVVSRQLRDASSDEDALEDAVADALSLLGFEVTTIGGGGEPDGIAATQLGHRGGEGSENYSLTYDAKSGGRRIQEMLERVDDDADGAASIASPQSPNETKAKPHRIRASTAQTSILKVHRQRHKADFTLLVAPGFQGEDLEESTFEEVCVSDEITPIRVEDLARLVELFPFRMVSPHSLRPLFEKCRTPNDCREFVDGLASSDHMSTPPIDVILDILLEYSSKRDPISIDALNAGVWERCKTDLGIENTRAIVRGLSALAPRSLYFDEGQVALNTSPDALRQELQQTLDPLPSDITRVYRDLLQINIP